MRPEIALFRGFSVCQSQSCARCVLACTSPVAVRVAVKPFEQPRMADLLITGDDRGVAGIRTGLASPGNVGLFLFSNLLRVAPYCVPGGVRVVSGLR